MKKYRVVLILIIALCFSVTLMGNESARNYFPATLDNSWVYVDEDGNEITRTVVEGEETSKAYSKRLTKEFKSSMDEEMKRIPPDADLIPQFDFDVKVEVPEHFFCCHFQSNLMKNGSRYESNLRLTDRLIFHRKILR